MRSMPPKQHLSLPVLSIFSAAPTELICLSHYSILYDYGEGNKKSQHMLTFCFIGACMRRKEQFLLAAVYRAMYNMVVREFLGVKS